jgi:AcrR family transcriptional regulator
MSRQEKNLRERRTQKLLREALIALIEERGFEALTIGELTERAMVSRGAFYRIYQDKYDLVEQIFEEAMSALFEAIGAVRHRPEHPPEIWVQFCEHIDQYDRLYRALLGRKGSPWFVQKMRARLRDLMTERGHLPHKPHVSATPVQTVAEALVPDLVSTMLVEAITWWLEQGKPYTPREIAMCSSLLASALFKEAST